MMRRAPIGILLVSATLTACGDGWRDDREPVTELAPGGAMSDAAEELRFEEDPRKLIYAPAVDLGLTVADTAGTADADTAQAVPAVADTTAADTTAVPPPDTMRARTGRDTASA